MFTLGKRSTKYNFNYLSDAIKMLSILKHKDKV